MYSKVSQALGNLFPDSGASPTPSLLLTPETHSVPGSTDSSSLTSPVATALSICRLCPGDLWQPANSSPPCWIKTPQATFHPAVSDCPQEDQRVPLSCSTPLNGPCRLGIKTTPRLSIRTRPSCPVQPLAGGLYTPLPIPSSLPCSPAIRTGFAFLMLL